MHTPADQQDYADERDRVDGPPRWPLWVALGVFGAGLLGLAVAFGTPLVGDHPAGLWAYLLGMLTPVGFVSALGVTLLTNR